MMHRFLSSIIPSAGNRGQTANSIGDGDGDGDAHSEANDNSSTVAGAPPEQEVSSSPPPRRRVQQQKKRMHCTIVESSSDNESSVDSPSRRKNTASASLPPRSTKKSKTLLPAMATSNSASNSSRNNRAGGSSDGWMDKSQLKAVAERFKGTASQFRVVYSGEYEIKDSVTKKMIPPHTLVVQNRFVSAAGNHGGQTCAFLAWRLPGRVSRHSMYKDTRPRFCNQDAPRNSNPVIVMDVDLHPMAKMLVSTFLNEAEPGTSPLKFYRDTECGEVLLFLTLAPDSIVAGDDSSSKEQHVLSNKLTTTDRNGVLGDELEDDDGGNKERESDDSLHVPDSDVDDFIMTRRTGALKKVVIDDEESEDESFLDSVNGTHKDPFSSKSPIDEESEDDNNFNALDDEDDPQIVDEGGGTKKKDDFAFDTAVDSPREHGDKPLKRPWPHSPSANTRSAKKQRKVYGGSKKQQLPVSTSFHVSDSAAKQFLVLVEGLVECQDDSTAVLASRDHLRDIFMERRVESMPRQGRLVELLPTEALPGAWLATIVGPNGSATRVPGFLRNNIRNLNGIRIGLRHESFRQLGLLSETRSMTIPGLTDKSPTRQLHVSAIDPSTSRTKDFHRQGVLDEDDDLPVIGSISIAACEGCTSFSDASSNLAGELASGLLTAAHLEVLEQSVGGVPSIEFLENLHPIPSQKETDHDPKDSTNIGISFLCQFNAKESYKVLVAQDEDGRTVAVDVLLGPSSRSSLSSTSTSSTVRRPQLTAANIQRLEEEEKSEDNSAVGTGLRDEFSCDSSEEDASESFVSSEGVAFDEGECEVTVVASNTIMHTSEHTLMPPTVPKLTPILHSGLETSSSKMRPPDRADPAREKRLPFDATKNHGSSMHGTETEEEHFVSCSKTKASKSSRVTPAAVTPALLKTKIDLKNAPQAPPSPAMMHMSTMPFVTPFAERRENIANQQGGLELDDDLDLDTLRKSVLDFNDSNHVSPSVHSTQHTFVSEAVRSPHNQTLMQQDCPFQKPDNICRAFSRYRSSWGNLGLVLVVFILLVFHLKAPSHLPETLRSGSRATVILHNSSFQDLLFQTEEALSAYGAFSMVESEWVSVIAVGLIVTMFGSV